MLAQLAVPFADVAAASLGLGIGLDPLPALEVLRLDVAGRAVEFRVLGASHQVLVRGAPELSETVACTLDNGPLPRRDARRLGTAAYHFRSSTTAHRQGTFLDAVDRVRSLTAGRADAIVAVFPGRPGAVTAVALREGVDSLGWQTWHCYPETGEIVATDTVVYWP